MKNTEGHIRLHDAVKREIYKVQHNGAEDGEDIGEFDPMED